MEQMLHEIITVKSLHQSDQFAPHADRFVTSLITLCYHYFLFDQHLLWRMLSLQAWAITKRHKRNVKSKTRQAVLSLLLGLECDPDPEKRWLPNEATLNPNSSWEYTRIALGQSLMHFLPQRFEDGLEDPSHPVTEVQSIKITPSVLTSVDLAAAAPELTPDLKTYPLWKAKTLALEVLCLIAEGESERAENLARSILSLIFDCDQPEEEIKEGENENPPILAFLHTPLTICALVRAFNSQNSMFSSENQ